MSDHADTNKSDIFKIKDKISDANPVLVYSVHHVLSITEKKLIASALFE